MATRFEILLHGEKEAALRAAGEEALDEVERLEAQLSLYRPAQRNRAGQRPGGAPGGAGQPPGLSYCSSWRNDCIRRPAAPSTSRLARWCAAGDSWAARGDAGAGNWPRRAPWPEWAM